MNSKNIAIITVLVAIIFAVGGYFIGKTQASNQAASVYKTPAVTSAAAPKVAPTLVTAMLRSANVDITPVGVAKSVVFHWSDGSCDIYDNSLPNGLNGADYWTHQDPCNAAIVRPSSPGSAAKK